MLTREIKNNVYAVGSIDWDRRIFDELIPLPEGTTYNSYIIKGSPAGETIELKQITLFPISGLKNPKTQKVLHMSERVFSKVIGEEYGAGYKFDELWEAVPGIWVMQLWHGDRKLAEKTFNVYIP